MNILGLDNLTFGVEDLDAAVRMAEGYGLVRREGAPGGGGVFEAQDGTSITIYKADDARLPPPVAAAPNIREVVYGVADKAALDAIGAELSKDRPVTQDAAGVLHSTDFDGYPIAFQVTVRRPVAPELVAVNAPGQPAGRPDNVCGADDDARPRPVTLSHVVLFTLDKHKAEAFYRDRLGFRTVDVFSNAGPFMRPQGTHDHHTLFLVQAGSLGPDTGRGLQHFTFHFAGPSQLLKRGWEMVHQGFKSAWGPGRHLLGSNYFWYFQSPFGGAMEMDADMDHHDDNWVPRVVELTPDIGQIFAFSPVLRSTARKAEPRETVLEAT